MEMSELSFSPQTYLDDFITSWDGMAQRRKPDSFAAVSGYRARRSAATLSHRCATVIIASEIREVRPARRFIGFGVHARRRRHAASLTRMSRKAKAWRCASPGG